MSLRAQSLFTSGGCGLVSGWKDQNLRSFSVKPNSSTATRVRLRLRPRRAELHPLFEDRDFLVRQLLLRRHLEVGILVADRLDDQRLVRIARAPAPARNRRPS